jgi:hypothetical protein
MEYRDDESFQELFNYADIGFPLAYAFSSALAEPLKIGIDFIDETFELLLRTLNVKDTGFESLEQLLDTAERNNKID